MTKIVRQGENRPGAMRRRAKHAQTTPLPPRCDECRLPAIQRVDGVPLCGAHGRPGYDTRGI